MLEKSIVYIKKNLYLIFLSIIGIILVLISTSKYGIGLTNDSASYISVARNLISGQGWMNFSGGLSPEFPPLFALILALFGLFGLDPIDSARVVNAVTFGLIIFTSGQLFQKLIKSKFLSIVSPLSILISFPLISVSVTAWTEPIFILLCVLFIYFLPNVILSTEKRLLYLVIISVIAALACLQRYLGVVLILFGAILIIVLMTQLTALERIKYVFIFCVISVAPLSFWLLRNFTLISTIAGERDFSVYSLFDNIFFTLDTVTGGWFIPESISSWIRMIGFFLIFPILVGIIIYSQYKFIRKSREEIIRIWSIGVFILLYTIILLISSTIMFYDKISNRLLSPIFIGVMLVFFIGIDCGLNWLNNFLRKEKINEMLVVGLCIAWLMYPIYSVSINVSNYIQIGAGGYNSDTWRNSPLILYIQNNPLDGTSYSNNPNAIYLLTGMDSKMVPYKSTNLTQFKASMSNNQNNYLIWFYKGRADVFCLEELQVMFELMLVKTLSDGAIYRFL